MGVHYQKRQRVGKNTFMNVYNGKLSATYKTRIGSLGSSGFSLRSGIPGLTFRHRYKKSQSELGLFLAVIAAGIGLFSFMAFVLWNFLRFSFWILSRLTVFAIALFQTGREMYLQTKVVNES